MKKYIGTIEQYNIWHQNAVDLLASGKIPQINIEANQVINEGAGMNQCYWDSHLLFEMPGYFLIDNLELDTVIKSFIDGKDGILAVLKFRKQKLLDNYSDSEEVLAWHYEINGISHLQYLYDKDVSDIVTTAIMTTGGTLWSFYDNTSAQMTHEELLSFASSAKEQDEFLWSHWGSLRNQINACTTEQELMEIDIYSGWN